MLIMSRVLSFVVVGLLFLSPYIHAQSIAPLIDTPGKTTGSDFNGDGIHDFIVGAQNNDDGGSNNEGAAYIFFGSTTLSGTKDLGRGQSADFTILGKGAGDVLGAAVAAAGDVNGDGIDDILIGALLNDEGGTDDEGAAYLFFGATDLSGTKALGGIDSADVTFLGKAANDFLGISLSGAGDVNGDGFDDLIISARNNDDGGGNDEGAAYIFFGSATLSGTKDLGGGQSADVTFLGKAATDILGGSVSGAGDVNGDGFDDVIVGAQNNNDGGFNNEGAAYVFFGSATMSGTKDTGNADEDVRFLGKGAGDILGHSVAGVGDVNGDGFDDIMVGATLNNDGGTDDEGAAYIFFGAANLSGTKDTGNADEDVRFLGKAANDYLGASVSGVGDINDDGLDDFIVGAYNNNDGGTNNEGAAYVFYGSMTLSGTKDLGGVDSADVTILGKGALDKLGQAVSGVGDLNADGFSDILVGARENNDGTGANNAGAAYVIFGSSTLSGTKALGLGQSADVTVLGKAASDILGVSVGGGRSNPGP